MLRYGGDPARGNTSVIGKRQIQTLVCSAIALLLLFAPGAPSWGQDSDAQVQPRVELSLRSWLFTAGETQWSHDASGLNPVLGDPTSKLKYKDNDTHLVGLGAKVHLNRRVFLDAEFGFSVDFDRGNLIDDDYLAGQRLFSRTSSDVTGKGTWYFNGNVGYRVAELPNERGHLDLLGGFQYWRTTYEAKGFVCDSSVLTCDPSTLPAVKNTTHWITPLQIGGQLEYRIVSRVSANVKMLFSPASIVYNEDIHFQRSDLEQDPSFSMWGVGLSATVEPTIKIMLTRHLALVGGYRVMWSRTYYGRWEVHGLGTGLETAPLTEFQTIRHGATVALTASF
jgi:Omptin family